MDAKLITFVGGGNMARALVRGLIASARPPADIRIADSSKEARSECAGLVSADKIFDSALDALAEPAEIIVIAVKPQNIAEVLPAIATSRSRGALVISIAAGVTIEYLEEALGQSSRVVRAMPNSPALVGNGITAVSAGSRAGQSGIQSAREVFSCVGDVIEIDEPILDAVTAISGSGPAYFFVLMKAMIAAGIRHGLTQDGAIRLVLATAAGSAKLAKAKVNGDFAELDSLIAAVASKGGTTAAALDVFRSKDIDDTLGAGIDAAYKRSKELGRR